MMIIIWITWLESLISSTSCSLSQWHNFYLHYFWILLLILMIISPLIINSSGCNRGLSNSCSKRRWGPSWGSIFGFGSRLHQLLFIAIRFDQNDVALWQEDAGQQAKAGSHDGKNLNGNHELASGAEIRRDKGDPHNEEDQHAKGKTFCLTVRYKKNQIYVMWWKYKEACLLWNSPLKTLQLNSFHV